MPLIFDVSPIQPFSFVWKQKSKCRQRLLGKLCPVDILKNHPKRGQNVGTRAVGWHAYIYIYIWVHLRPPKTGLERSFAAPHAFICGPPFLKPLFLIARNGFLAVSGNQVSSLFSDFSGFSKMHFGGRRGRFLRSGKIFVFCVCFWSGSSRHSPRGSRTRNPSKQGVSEQFLRCGASFTCVGPIVSAWCCSTFLTQIFRGLTNLFFRKFEFLTNLGLEGKKRPGAAELRRFSKWRFSHFARRGQFVNFWARFRRTAVSRFGVRFGPLPEICLRLRCGWFFPSFPWLFFRHLFCEFEKGSFWNSPLFFSCFALFCVFFLSLGRRNPARVFWGSWP